MRLNTICNLNVLCLDEAGQVLAELLSVMDMILRRILNNDIIFSGILILCTIDHARLPLYVGNPFFISCHILSCFQIVRLEHSAHANADPLYRRLQDIARIHPGKHVADPMFPTEFRDVASRLFIFVSDWNCKEIDQNPYSLYGKNITAKKVTAQYIEQVQSHYDNSQLREK